jgi:peptidyl-prolyl cis-trans isomerase SurA
MQFTEDRNFSQGGLLGTFKSGEFLPELEKSVQPLDPGKYSNVVKTDLGYHIVLLIKRNLVANPKMADEHEQITRKLYQEAFEKQFKYWLEQRRKAAFIRKNV